MTRPCGCGGSAALTCNCVVVAGDRATVTGTGVPEDPYVVSAQPMTCEEIQDCVALAIGDGLAWDPVAREFSARPSTDPGNVLLFGSDGGLYVSEDGILVPAQPRGRIGRSGGAAQSIPNNTPVVVTFDAALVNVGTVWAAGTPNRLTATRAGGWDVGSTVRFQHNGSAAVETGVRQVQIRLNGGTVIAEVALPPVLNVVTTVNVSTQVDLVVGDYIEVIALQTEGMALTLPIGSFPNAPVAWAYFTTE
jgi:hypothetical protein